MTELFQKMQQQGVLIDANLLVLLVVGMADMDLIGKHKRLGSYSKFDFEVLAITLDRCSKIVATSHILAETSNLATSGCSGDVEFSVFQAFEIFVSLPKFSEVFLEAKEIVNKDKFHTYGLSDIGLIELVRNNYVLFTDDFRLAGYAENIGLDVVNFKQIKYLLSQI